MWGLFQKSFRLRPALKPDVTLLSWLLSSIFALTWKTQALWMKMRLRCQWAGALKLPVSLPFLFEPEGPRGAPAIPTWGEQYPKIILVCFPKALVNRWFLKSSSFPPSLNMCSCDHALKNPTRIDVYWSLTSHHRVFSSSGCKLGFVVAETRK